MTSLAVKQHLVSKIAARKNGAAVTFTSTSQGTYDPTTDTYSASSTSTVVGVAQRVRGDAERYKALELTESEAVTLLFTPDTAGEQPALLSLATFGGEEFTVREVEPWAPGGATVSCRVVVAR